jgi:hypothetical protein
LVIFAVAWVLLLTEQEVVVLIYFLLQTDSPAGALKVFIKTKSGLVKISVLWREAGGGVIAKKLG